MTSTDNPSLRGYHCDICGVYRSEHLKPFDELTPAHRAILSHLIRTNSDAVDSREKDRHFLEVTADLVDSVRSGRIPPPTKGAQVRNALLYIGDVVTHSGDHLDNFPPHFYAVIGAPNPRIADRLAVELVKEGLLSVSPMGDLERAPLSYIDLTIKGWERYEAEKHGKQTGASYGFIAMKFDDPELDAFVNEVVKPAVKEGTGYELVDLRDVGQAGIIDNIMRDRIKDARFVLVELTHENRGAYWEGGYAEGLSKPVIYLCEASKFEDESTHFDTNHCTTIKWSSDGDQDAFRQELISTLRLSLAER